MAKSNNTTTMPSITTAPTLMLVKRSLGKISRLLENANYSHDNFLRINEEVSKIRKRISLQSLKVLEDLWRDSYTLALEGDDIENTMSYILSEESNGQYNQV
jgi:hypothetical protein